MKQAYYYLFYKLYKLFEQEELHWLREWRVYGLINIIDCIFFFSLFLYYEIFINRYVNLGDNTKLYVLLIVVIICIINYLIFFSKNQWRRVIEKFDKIPKRKNYIGTLIVYSIIALIIGNLINAFYLMGQIDWSLYK